jgi:hypothetical protein
MRKTTLLSAVAIILLPLTADAWVGYSKTFEVRQYTAEVPPAAAAPSVMRIGVKLPRAAEIPKVEVFVDREMPGQREGDWSSCDINSKKCEVDDARIVRFHRNKHQDWQELSVEIENSSQSESRYARLRVTYKDPAGKDRTGCGAGVSVRCGFAEAVTD